jgi:hypothetical protein
MEATLSEPFEGINIIIIIVSIIKQIKKRRNMNSLKLLYFLKRVYTVLLFKILMGY